MTAHENSGHPPGIKPEKTGNEQNEDFATLLESYMDDVSTEVRVGEKIPGKIIAIGEDSVFLNTGTKSDGVVEKAELLDENGEFPYKVGDLLELYVIDTRDGEIRLSKVVSGSRSPELLYDAYQNKIPVEGKVTETCKGGFRVKVLGQNAFCPISQMDINYIEDAEAFVGQTLKFIIERMESGGRNLVVNRRRYLEQLMAEERENYLASVKTGDIVKGRVSRIMPYGAFVELHSWVEGMVHISEISWARVSDISEVLNVGDTLPVKILSIEKTGGKHGGVRISLSARQATEDPWKTVGSRYRPGEKFKGKVTRCLDFGAFVELEPGIEGLVHISEISHTRRVVRVENEVTPGQTVAVMVKSVDPINRRISLSMKDAEGDPWLDLEDRLSVGQIVSGRLESKADFGYFINLAPGITGLVPKSKMATDSDLQTMEKLKTDEQVTVKIVAVNPTERKIELAPANSGDTEDWGKYTETDSSPGSGLGALGVKLREAMKSGKQDK